jgi:hypothetical protein
MTRRRAALLAGAALLVTLLVLVLQGGYETYGPAVLGPLERPAPDWTRPCWRRKPKTPLYTVRCARAHGIVVYVEQHDPDGDGDRHAILLAGLRLVKLKYPRGVGPLRLPGVGSRVEAVGHVPGGGFMPEVIVEPQVGAGDDPGP